MKTRVIENYIFLMKNSIIAHSRCKKTPMTLYYGMKKNTSGNLTDMLAACGFEWGRSKLQNCYFSGGMDSTCPLLPRNVLAWAVAENLVQHPPMVHQRLVLTVPADTVCELKLDGILFRLHPGEMLLMHPYQVHAYGDRFCRLIWISFLLSESEVRLLLPLKNRKLPCETEDRNDIRDILAAFQRLNGVSPSAGIAALVRLLDRRLHAEKELPTPAAGSTLARICSYWHEHREHPVTLKETAAAFGLAESTLRRMFHRQFGPMTPREFLWRIRLCKAQELLGDTEQTVAAVARECGFPNPFSFSRAFKRKFGVSPLVWRKKHIRR